MELTVTLKVKIDDTAWAREYGVLFSEVEADVLGYFDGDVIASTLNGKRALGPMADVTGATVAKHKLAFVTITTEYQGPTDTRGSRIVARATVRGQRHQRTFPYDHAQRDMHEYAALAFAGRLQLDHVKLTSTDSNSRAWSAVHDS